MTIKPVNGHLLIEPIAHETFIASQKDTYEEIGIVIGVASDLKTRTVDVTGGGSPGGYHRVGPVKEGDHVYFDSWLAARYPKDDKSFYWLVKWEDVRAVEYAEQK